MESSTPEANLKKMVDEAGGVEAFERNLAESGKSYTQVAAEIGKTGPEDALNLKTGQPRTAPTGDVEIEVLSKPFAEQAIKGIKVIKS